MIQLNQNIHKTCLVKKLYNYQNYLLINRKALKYYNNVTKDTFKYNYQQYNIVKDSITHTYMKENKLNKYLRNTCNTHTSLQAGYVSVNICISLS